MPYTTNDIRNIESKWQKIWDKRQTFRVKADASKPKYYVLEMFPYPSGKIHMGHVRNYTIADVIARYKMMRGFNVLHPMGFNVFGQPAENAAIKNKTNPVDWTYRCIKQMHDELKKMGFSYDWLRELSTCDAEYYKWNQWIFIRMFERGLAYKKASSVNWCPDYYRVAFNRLQQPGEAPSPVDGQLQLGKNPLAQETLEMPALAQDSIGAR